MKYGLTILLGLIQMMVSCDYPEVDPAPTVSNNPDSTVSSTSSERRVIVEFDLSFVVRDNNTSDSIDGVKVFYDVFLNRPYPPFMDAYLISNNIPGTTSVVSSGGGRGTIPFTVNVSDEGKDVIYFILQLSAEPDGYDYSTRSFDLLLQNDLTKDTLIISNDQLILPLRVN